MRELQYHQSNIIFDSSLVAQGKGDDCLFPIGFKLQENKDFDSYVYCLVKFEPPSDLKQAGVTWILPWIDLKLGFSVGAQEVRE